MKKLKQDEIKIVLDHIDKSVEKMKNFSESEPSYNIGYYGCQIKGLVDLIRNGYPKRMTFEGAIRIYGDNENE